MSIGINDPLDAFEALCRERGACQEALDYIASARARGWTVRDLIAGVRAHDASEGSDWCIWARLTLADQMTFAARLAFSDEGTKDDPRMAAHLDIYVATSATEGALLASRWTADELPNIARQIEDGVVERRRDR